jgi:Arm domain-containing DNA-binding protein
MRTKLTHTVAEALKARGRAYIAYDSEVPGFGCRVTPKGARSWVFEYRPGGGRRSATRRMTLGRVEALPAPTPARPRRPSTIAPGWARIPPPAGMSNARQRHSGLLASST